VCSAEAGQRRETSDFAIYDGPTVTDLDPGVGDERLILPGYPEAKPACYAAPSQHGMRGERTGQT
jgi:hypothetical protein